MERQEPISPGDSPSASGSLPGEQEAKASVFEDGQNRDTTGKIRMPKDAESFVYGDSRPDETAPSDTFTSIDDSPMMNTTREGLPDVEKPTAEFLRETSHGENDEIRPHYRKEDGSEGQELVVEGKVELL